MMTIDAINALPCAFRGGKGCHELTFGVPDPGESCVRLYRMDLVPADSGGVFVTGPWRIEGVFMARDQVLDLCTSQTLCEDRWQDLRDQALHAYLWRAAALICALKLRKRVLVTVGGKYSSLTSAFPRLRTDDCGGNVAVALIHRGQPAYAWLNRTVTVKVWRSPEMVDEPMHAWALTLDYMGPALRYEIDAPHHHAIEELMGDDTFKEAAL
jgi:hypothetical protein